MSKIILYGSGRLETLAREIAGDNDVFVSELTKEAILKVYGLSSRYVAKSRTLDGEVQEWCEDNDVLYTKEVEYTYEVCFTFPSEKEYLEFKLKWL